MRPTAALGTNARDAKVAVDARAADGAHQVLKTRILPRVLANGPNFRLSPNLAN
jgi:hypothetical protein